MWSLSRLNRHGIDLPESYLSEPEQQRLAAETLAALPGQARPAGLLGRLLGREDAAALAGDQLTALVRLYGPWAYDAGGGRHRRLPGPLATHVRVLLAQIISAVPPADRRRAFERAEAGVRALEGSVLPGAAGEPFDQRAILAALV